MRNIGAENGIGIGKEIRKGIEEFGEQRRREKETGV